jgi:serine/threonine-protein kinase
MQNGRYAEACPKLEDSQRLDPGIGTLYNLADCFEHVGRTASAWSRFREVAGQAVASGQASRADVARGRAQALEPKLVRLTVEVAPENADMGAEVTRDGTVLLRSLWGTGVPVDPGKHTIAASLQGQKAWEQVVEVGAKNVTVSIPKLAPISTPRAIPPSAPPVETAKPQPSVAVAPRSWQQPLGITLTALGAVGLGVGTGIGLSAKASYDRVTADGCNSSHQCDDGTRQKQRSLATQGNISTGVFLGGAAFLVGGLVVWISAPSKSPNEPAKLAIRATLGGASLESTW